MNVTPPKVPSPRVDFAVTSSCGMLFGVADGADFGAVPSTSVPSESDCQLGPRKWIALTLRDRLERDAGQRGGRLDQRPLRVGAPVDLYALGLEDRVELVAGRNHDLGRHVEPPADEAVGLRRRGVGDRTGALGAGAEPANELPAVTATVASAQAPTPAEIRKVRFFKISSTEGGGEAPPTLAGRVCGGRLNPGTSLPQRSVKKITGSSRSVRRVEPGGHLLMLRARGCATGSAAAGRPRRRPAAPR